MKTTDIETAAEGLLFNASEGAETETEEATQEDATEAEEVEVEEVETPEDEAETAEDDDAEEAEPEGEDDDEEEDEVSEQPSTFKVKVDGEEREVTLEELTRSYSGQSYIQKGMQEAAEVRKQAQELQSKLQAEQQQFVDFVQQLQSEGVKSAPQKPDAKLLDSDPIGYMQANAKYEAEMAEYKAQQTQFAQVQERQTKLQEEQRQAYLQEQLQELKVRVPEFANPETAAAVQEKLVKTGVEHYGFSADELSAVTDARTVQVLADAMRWRDLQAGKAEAKKKPKPPKAIAPTGRRQQPADVTRKKMLQQAKRSGKTEDFAALLLEPKNG